MSQGIRANAIHENALAKLSKPKNSTPNKVEDFDFTQLFANALGNGKNQSEKTQIENQLIEKTNEKKEKKDNKNKVNQDVSTQEWSQQAWSQNVTMTPQAPIQQKEATQNQNIVPVSEQAGQTKNKEHNQVLSSKTSPESQNDGNQNSNSFSKQNKSDTTTNHDALNNPNESQKIIQTESKAGLGLSEARGGLEPIVQTAQAPSSISATTDHQKLKPTLEQGQSITIQSQIEPSQTMTLNDSQNTAVDKTAHVLMQQAIAKGHHGTESNHIQSSSSKKLSIDGIGEIRQTVGNLTPSTGQPTLGSTPLIQVKTPVTAPGFVREVSHHLQTNINKNSSVIDLKISPDAFGTVNMRIVQRGSELHLVIRAKDEKTADALQQSLAGLKENLAQAGINLGQVQVTGSGSASQNSNNPGSASFNQSNFAQNSQDSSNSNHGQQRSSQNSNNAQVHNPENDKVDSIDTSKARSNQDLAGGIDVFA